MSKLRKMLKNEKGQGLVEYALILVLIALVTIAAITATGDKSRSAFEKINNQLGNSTSSSSSSGSGNP